MTNFIKDYKINTIQYNIIVKFINFNRNLNLFLKYKVAIFSFFSIFNINKIINIFYLYYFFIIKKASHFAKPYAISIEPTTSCNLRCPQCISGLRNFTRPVGMLDLENYKHIINEIKKKTIHLNLYFQGEPYLNPSFFEMVNYAKENKIMVSTSTNAHYLSLENAEKTVYSGLHKIIISMDGNEQESYEKYRIGGDLLKVKTGIDNLLNAKSKLNSFFPIIYIQFIVFKHNEHEVENFKKWAQSKNVKFTIKSAQVYDYQHDTDFIPDNKSLSRYQKNEKNAYELISNYQNKCWKMWHSAVITWDGNVLPCCFDKDASHKMGNVLKNSFESIWNSENYINFRQKLFNSRKEIDICTNCTEGSPVFV